MAILNKNEGDILYIVRYEVVNGTEELKRNYYLEAVCSTKEQADEHVTYYMEIGYPENITIYECEIKKVTKPWA